MSFPSITDYGLHVWSSGGEKLVFGLAENVHWLDSNTAYTHTHCRQLEKNVQLTFRSMSTTFLIPHPPLLPSNYNALLDAPDDSDQTIVRGVQ